MELFSRFWNSFAGLLLELLPLSPTVDNAALETFRTYVGYINYFIPIGGYLNFLSGFLVCLAIYNSVLPILRNLKLVK